MDSLYGIVAGLDARDYVVVGSLFLLLVTFVLHARECRRFRAHRRRTNHLVGEMCDMLRDRMSRGEGAIPISSFSGMLDYWASESPDGERENADVS